MKAITATLGNLKLTVCDSNLLQEGKLTTACIRSVLGQGSDYVVVAFWQPTADGYLLQTAGSWDHLESFNQLASLGQYYLDEFGKRKGKV